MTQGKFEWNIEILNHDTVRGGFKFAVFDFDGTISLIREGWQQIMMPYFTEELMATPGGREKPVQELSDFAREFIFINTGKQTIYQCIQLADEIKKLGGSPQNPMTYKDEYSRRLLERIQHRLDGLKSGALDPRDHVVPGSFELLDGLKDRGVEMYLASGTDEEYVLMESALLGVDKYFGKHIYGAQSDYKNFSKKIVIDRLIKDNNLHGSKLLGFGDGYVEIENVKSVGGFTCGVASDEANRCGIDEWKRNRLLCSHADIIVPDYTHVNELLEYIFKEG